MLERFNKILVTGGAGFVGSYVCEEILKHKSSLLVIDDLSTGKKQNLFEGADFARIDISNFAEVFEAMEGIDLVFHTAAQPSARHSVEDPDLDFSSNALGTFNVFAAARRAGVKKVVYTSSSAAYGEPEKLPISEMMLPRPSTPYGASKYCGENYCRAFSKSYGLEFVALRPFNVYGQRENLETSLDEVIHYTDAILRETPIEVNGDGNQTRDFIHASDVGAAHVLAAQRDASGEIFNVGTGIQTTINGLIRAIEQVTGKTARVQRKPWPEGDVYREFADTRLASEKLGFTARKELKKGLEELAEALSRVKS